MNFNYPKLEPFNFLGLPNQNYKKSKVVIFPVPYNSTTYWKSGTKEGPQAIIEASRHLELYDIEGLVRAFSKEFKNFSLLQLDAHLDSREEFEGTKYHHGCVIKRIRDLGIAVTQVGIRSLSEEEAQYIKKEKIKTIFYAPQLPINKIIATLKENVYLTCDLDVFDSSLFPAVGTPEPGGLQWSELLNLIKQIAKKRKIVGADVVELCPIPGIWASDFLAAKLVFKIISYSFLNKKKRKGKIL
mgnify:CR=1 FL=1